MFSSRILVCHGIVSYFFSLLLLVIIQSMLEMLENMAKNGNKRIVKLSPSNPCEDREQK